MRTRFLIVTGIITAAIANPYSQVKAVDLYANGFVSAPGPNQYQGIWNQAGVGVGGSNVSVLANPPNLTFGVSATISTNSSIADNFTVAPGQIWQVTSLKLYAYQTDAVSFPFLQANVSLTGSDPNGAALESATGVTVNQGSGGIVARRVTPTTLTSDERRIWEIEVPLNTAWTIASGDYYLRWSISVASGSMFVTPIVPTISGNGMRSASGGSYAPATDAGSGVTMDFPFLIVGTVVPEPSTVILSGIAGLFVIGAVRKKRVAR